MQEELLMEIRVRCDGPVSVKGTEKQIVMIPFTGEASGPYFNHREGRESVPVRPIYAGRRRRGRQFLPDLRREPGQLGNRLHAEGRD